MYMLIRVLVPAVGSSEAASTTRYALDCLIGIRIGIGNGNGNGASTAFDYYKTLDESTTRYRDHPRYGDIDPALSLQSETGRQFLEDAVEAQEAWLHKTLDKLRVKLESLDLESVIDDVNLTRFDWYRLGEFAGPSVWIYDRHGAGLRSRSAVERHLEHNGEDKLWVVPADVHY
jgi:hypothetical protein